MTTKRVAVTRKYFKVVPERIRPTKYVQRPLSGQMAGRKLVPRRLSDRTSIIRITTPFDVNKDGKIDNRDLLSGQIIGRVPRGARPNRVVIKRYYNKRGAVRSHARRRR